MAKFQLVEDSESLQQIILQRLPASAYVYNIIKRKKELSINIFTLCLTEDENDTWIITTHYDRKDLGPEIVVSSPTEIKKHHFQTIKEALIQDERIINWSEKYFIPAIPRAVSSLFIQAALESENVIELRPCYYFCRYDPIQTISCPEGVEFRNLTEDDAGVVVKNWKFAKDSTIPYVQKMIRELPSVGVIYQGELVSGILTSAYGIAAFLFTDEKHRRKGYAKLAMLYHLNQMKLNGLIPVSTVEARNEGSVRLHHQCEMEFVDCVDYLIRE